MFKIGDIVRLARGWTPMVVLGFDNHNRICAAYCNKTYYPITQEHYDFCITYADYIRSPNGFAHWDGKPLSYKVYKPMPLRYRIINTPMSGTYLTTTSNGKHVLELENGAVDAFDPSEIEEDLPNTFKVSSIKNSYSCHYELPYGVTMNLHDVLVSKSGNMYIVTEVNSKNRNPKGVFKGQRLVKQEL